MWALRNRPDINRQTVQACLPEAKALRILDIVVACVLAR